MKVLTLLVVLWCILVVFARIFVLANILILFIFVSLLTISQYCIG